MLLGPEADPAQAAVEMPMPLETFVSRLEQERAGTTDGTHCWRSGQQISLPSIGVLGEAIAPRRTLGEALRLFARGFPVLQSNSSVTLEVTGDEAHVSYRVLDPRIWPRRADAELTLGLIRGICDRYAVPREAIQDLCFEHQPDRDLRALARHLGRMPRFGQDENRITFSASALSHRLRTEPPGDAMEPAKRLDEALVELRRQTPVSQRVHALILSQMQHGLVNQADVAALLGMSERGLRRALAAEGQPFHAILEECRRAHGFALLVRGDRLFGEIALLLGYSDQTAFSRAFSRWYGVSPREIRKMGAEEVSVIR
ncbi:MAG: AraC family transcriptional regulator ligand-binding domain-containing protein [Paracoccus aminovorans]|nr:AraC family transcriptional regulator ligand-binding domain-containing protein [Paracoccus aminovorans]